MAGTLGTGTERTYRSHYSGQPVLIKGYIPKPDTKIKILERATSNVKLHVELGDFMAWGEDESPAWGSPRYMIVIKDKSGYHSASSAFPTLGRDQMEVLRSHAIRSDLSKRKNKP